MLTLLVTMASGYIYAHIHELHYAGHFAIFPSFLLALIAMAVAIYANELHIKNLNLKLMLYMLSGLWRHLLSLPMKTLNKYLSGDLSQKLFDYEASMTILLSTILSLIFGLVSLLSLLVYMMYCHLYLAYFYLALCCMLSLFKWYFMPENMRYINGMLIEQGKLTQYVNEMLLQIHKIRSSGVENIVFKRWLKNVLKVKQQAEKSLVLELRVMVIELWMPISLLIIFYSFLYLFPSRTDTYLLLQFMICAGQFSAIFDKLSAHLVTALHLMPALKRMQPLLAEQPESYDLAKINTRSCKGDLHLKNVSLCHAGSGRLMLEQVSLHFPAGQFIAIIGRSGAGKSTLLRVLLGLESDYTGSYLIDQQSIANYNVRDLRKHFGVVLQTTSILPGTILSNLAANTSITHDEACALARLVGLDAEINAMPMKMHTYISDNAGESISGGQKQKILIARALASKPKVLLLDEATSALDNHSQALIFANLQALNMTRIVIAHRYTTIQHADLIYQLDHGKVTAQGTYAELFGGK